LYAQLTIKGKVLDADSRQPLVSASVYCENTTLFTTTDATGNFSLLMMPGGYNLIISYTGYETQAFRVSESNEKMFILLAREDRRLKEVVVTTKSRLVEDGWNNYGSYFMQNFIGTTPNAEECRLQNPEALKFYYYSESNKIKVFATAPLKISNKAFGYTLSYALDSFVYLFADNICSYWGICRYTEMEGNDNQKKTWARNRKRAYEGSVLHFMRSYYKGTLSSDGWDIALQQENDPETFDRVANPFDRAYYVRIKENEEIELQFPRRIRVRYLKKEPEPEYLEKYSLPRKMTILSSAVDLKEKIRVKENGYYYHQLSWISYNYWSWKNMADILPYDYIP
jgi:hypothetical protein